MNKLVACLALLSLTAQAQPPEARLIFEAGMTKMREAGELAQRGQFVPANELIAAASAEIDRAVELAPDDLELRARRGLLWGRMTYLPGKAEASTADLRFVSGHPAFGTLNSGLRDAVSAMLGDTRPDRFPEVDAATSPVIAVVSFTLPAVATGGVPEWVGATVGALEGYPGLLGTHAVASVDHRGMYLLFTWWTDKQALNDFFYGELHQVWMRQRGVGMTSAANAAAQDIPTQTAAEVLAGFPGGLQINGGFAPQAVIEWQTKAK